MSTSNGDPRGPSASQVSPLPAVTAYYTGHDEAAGTALVASTRPAEWKSFEEGAMGFHQIYTNDFPADLNGGKDIAAHDEVLRGGKLGLVKKGGVVCRQVDFSPSYECMMHRTQSVDFGVVLEGSVWMILDDGSRTLMRRGDVAVQRATMHAWRNASETEWARMMFVLQDIKPLIIKGEKYGEDLGPGTEGLPASGNDQ